jgi:carbamoyl-phosphate synthase small subunit
LTDASTTDRAVLVLADGTRYTGRAYGAVGRTLGEVVFATGMTGYQETLTDPSYAGQIVVMTAPHIGNTGVNDTDPESRRIWVAGYVVRDASRVVSNHRAQGSLDDQLVADGIVGIRGIDTRAVTRRLREVGSMKGGVFSGPDAGLDPDEQLALVTAGADMRGLNLSSQVSTVEPYVLQAEGDRIGSVAVLDLGVKTSTLRYLAQRGFEVHVLPQSTTLDELRTLAPDALFYSNGPGDPAASDSQVELLQGALRDGLPYFGICFGNQLFGRALGFGTYKLPFGHRGINQPVLDKTTNKVEITSQNHGFAVDAPIDGVLDIPAFSVQYHPEAAAGPHDSNHLFDRFREAVVARTNGQAVDFGSDIESSN